MFGKGEGREVGEDDHARPSSPKIDPAKEQPL
jgi:hypothetical protein